MSDDGPPRVAIACQGGGTHSAFTAGVLQELMPAVESDYDLVGISGTSGGALCAVTAWYGLLRDGPDHAGDLLDAVWADVTASSPAMLIANNMFVGGLFLGEAGFPLPEVSPYTIPGKGTHHWFRQLLKRHLAFDEFDNLVTATSPELRVGAVDVNQGTFKTFTDAEITADEVLASAALPTVFEAVERGGASYWDGLFSQNPPVREFLTEEGPKPDELWVVQINPQTRETVPKSLEAIADRRNELAGNLSLNQELAFIETVNEWVDAGYLPDEYQHVTVRRLQLERRLGTSTKYNRAPDFIQDMIQEGQEQAKAFLDGVDSSET